MNADAPPRPVLKLALYQPWIYLHGGLERSILELVTRSRHDWTIFTGYYDAAGTFPAFAKLDVRPLRPTTVNRSMLGVLKSAIQVMRQKLPLDPDINGVVVWCDGIGDLVTFRNHALPVFNICSTPLRAVFDPSYEAQALQKRGMLERVFYALFRTVFRSVDRLAWRHYRGVVATSSEVKARILVGRLCTRERIVMAYPGIDWVTEPPGITYEPFILVSGRIMWTKNIELAIRAFLAARLPYPWRLVVAGYVDKKSAAYLADLRAMAGRAAVDFIVSPSDAVMSDLLRRASFCLFTPLNEDWGIAPLEAMAQAKPVIAVNAGGPRESIAHAHSGYLLPPAVPAWSDCISSLAGDPALVRKLGRQAHAHVEQFTWDRFVTRVDNAIESWMARDQRAGPAVQHGHGADVADRRLVGAAGSYGA